MNRSHRAMSGATQYHKHVFLGVSASAAASVGAALSSTTALIDAAAAVSLAVSTVAGEEDETLGERLVLIVENPRDSADSIANRIRYIKDLTKFEVPKHIYITDKFVETVNGKIQRAKTIESVLG